MLKAPLPEKSVIAAWSQVADGNMSERFGPLEDVVAHRTKFLGSLGLKIDDCVRLAVTNGTADRIRVVGRDQAGEAMTGGEAPFYCDAFITDEPGVGLWLLIADCIPVMFFDPKTPRIALAHCGTVSTNLRLSAKMVAKLRELGSDPADLQVSLGPSIKAASYIFDHEHMKPLGPEWDQYLTHPDPDHTSIDIAAYNVDQLVAAGVPKANIHVSDVDTGTSKDFYSHVRSWRSGDAEGRFAAVIALNK